MINILQGKHWAIITATQETLGAHNSPANEAANADLAAELNLRGHVYTPISGVWNGVEQGLSFLLHVISCTEAMHLAYLYNQDCVVFPRGLVYLAGDFTPFTGRLLFGADAESQPGYSRFADGTAFAFETELLVNPS
jgi:hypothetical protein